ncbi:MAG: DUF6318 family protein [Nocardioides sp.]
MDHGRGQLRAVAVTLAIAVSVLAGCSTSDDASQAADPASPASSSASTDPSVEPSPSAADEAQAAAQVPPAPEVPPARKGQRGQRAFARYVMAAWAWSLRANDAGPLLEVSPPGKQPCRGCRPLQKELAQRAKEGWYVDFPGLSVDRTRLRRDGGDVVATSKVDIPESDSFLEDGSYRSTSPAHPNATFTVRMMLTKGEYRLVSFTVS